ncbi:MAG TPA: GMC family oxidoreductase [Chloroflexota bacterium]|nr:GMC family oxidoreductase [Chloroflexota bacterium]
MNTPLFGAFEGPKPGKHMLGPIQNLDAPMRHYGREDEVDFVIVGIGSAGGVLIQRLARAGFKVVGFDAGPFWDVERDWVSDEAGSHKLYWTDQRIIGGSTPIALGENNSGRGVGGGSVHWAAFAPRLHPSDFRVYSEDGVGVDWPMSYWDLKPYYELLEHEMPVSGPAYYPWGDPHGYPYGPHPVGGTGATLIEGCTKLGIRVSIGGPVAINSGSHGDRPHCIYRGFCIQGCKVGAKQSTLYSHVPDAIEHGAEIRDNCMVFRVNMKDGLTTGISYYDAQGNEREQKAKVVIVSGYAIETPRLLLNSACPGFENGLANSSGMLGKCLMVQAGDVVVGRYAEPVRMYKAPPAHALTEEFYETDPKRDFARGFAIQTVGPLPIAFSKQMMATKGAWGWGMRRAMMDYNHWSAIALLGELLPWEDNTVSIAKDVTDQHGIPVAHVRYNLHDNDKKLAEYGCKVVQDVQWAAGAEKVVSEQRFAHLVGAARMGSDPRSSVTTSFGRTHDVPNLFICDGSLFPTQGSANPGLTIQSLAARAGDYLIWQGDNILHRGQEREGTPPIRRDLSPRGTSGRGMPRLKSSQQRIEIGI